MTRFLAKSEEIAALAPDQPSALASVASAYACKYATTGDTSFRDKSLEQLERARAAAGAVSEEFAVYENRIRHRLQSREIITGKEFEKRFPHGWKAEGGE
jgi:hypothetical protein